ncbi:hypothetical protein DL767_005564 [Monosporascus sp. MG133]|nr:hypothetical protein DL767_005564 [Monosporascus sp. MG133]
MASKVVLISGTTKGIGKGLLEIYLTKPNHTVIAANRDPEHASSKALHHLPTGTGSRLIVVKVDASVESDASEAIKKLTSQGIDHLDLVIADAGIASKYPKVSELRISDLLDHMTPNVFGVIWLFQATLPLLLQSERPTTQIPFPNAAYSTTKVAIHWLTKKINAEEERLNAFVVNPGFCQTDLGNHAAHLLGMEKAFVPVEESVPKLVELIDGATKESHGGRFWNYTGKEIAW